MLAAVRRSGLVVRYGALPVVAGHPGLLAVSLAGAFMVLAERGPKA